MLVPQTSSLGEKRFFYITTIIYKNDSNIYYTVQATFSSFSGLMSQKSKRHTELIKKKAKTS
ncbi:hypothetical protein VIBNISOn1_560034 [Vibrio nigripulchritudo SOn1]|uniref:Uncharacterized protein n=1 Tax=Vibrio nigripulchritudo SOn1 TaxID=1238450 RepID=A0AAV2VV46_9VIBR|nr:hypothetical protein VIBNISOn1_560034 [Vibrio nigripulchritudo SOn1]